MKTLTEEQVALLNKPLPREALKPHPTKSYLTTINSIYVTERLNDVFGVGAWRIKTEQVDSKDNYNKDGKVTNRMVVTKTIFEVPEYGIYMECFGGNDNADLGDAYKGSTTDALTKIGSYLGIGAHVWKNDPYPVEDEKVKDLLRVIKEADTIDKLKELWEDYPECQGVSAVANAFSARKKELMKGGVQ